MRRPQSITAASLLLRACFCAVAENVRAVFICTGSWQHIPVGKCTHSVCVRSSAAHHTRAKTNALFLQDVWVLAVLRAAVMLGLYLFTTPASSSSASRRRQRQQQSLHGPLGAPVVPNHEQVCVRVMKCLSVAMSVCVLRVEWLCSRKGKGRRLGVCLRASKCTSSSSNGGASSGVRSNTMYTYLCFLSCLCRPAQQPQC